MRKKEKIRISNKEFEELKKNKKIPTFTLHEVLKLRGGRFRIVSIGKKEMRLRGMPGTHIVQLEKERTEKNDTNKR